MSAWKKVLNDNVSFLDDHYYGGSVKHLFNFSGSFNTELPLTESNPRGAGLAGGRLTRVLI